MNGAQSVSKDEQVGAQTRTFMVEGGAGQRPLRYGGGNGYAVEGRASALKIAVKSRAEVVRSAHAA